MTAIGSTTAAPASAPRLTQMEQARQAAMASAEREQQARRAAAGAPPSSTSPYGMTGDPEIAAARTKIAAVMGMTLERYEERDAEIIRGAKLNMPASGPLFANAGEAAAEGSRLVSSLGSTVNGANSAKDMLNSSTIEGWRRTWGDTAAEQMVSRLTATVARYGEFLKQEAEEIGQKFTVSGTLVQRDEAGRWSLGAFAIETRVGSVGVRIGSDAVARTSPVAKPGAPTATAQA